MLNNKKLIWILLSAIAVVSVVAYTMINGANNAVTRHNRHILLDALVRPYVNY